MSSTSNSTCQTFGGWNKDLSSEIMFARFSVQVFNTYSNEDYDRRNEEVDPVASSAEYELEKRVEKLELFPVELEKGNFFYFFYNSILITPFLDG